MNSLYIKLSNKFKSFEPGFEQTLKGDLVIISGVNGSGKSQLLNIISRTQIHHNGLPIGPQANIRLNNQDITASQVIYKSFKNHNLGEFQEFGPQNNVNPRNIVIGSYDRNRLDLRDTTLAQYQDSTIKLRDSIARKYGPQYLERPGPSLKEDQLTECLMEAPWVSDDIFSNQISNIFYNYAAQKLHDERQKGSKTVSSIAAPWTVLNKLLKDLSIDYRVGDSYDIKSSDLSFQLTPKVELHPISGNGQISTTEARSLSDLSEGEQAIIGLVFSVLYGTDGKSKKILLLDEYDATFNPSLTEAFYKIIKEYYINREIMVIIASHSVATISLAPKYAVFYEMFRASEGNNSRIIGPVNRGEYKELEIANREIYRKIKDQKIRIEELNKRAKERKEVIEDANNQIRSNGLKIVSKVYLEGITDKKYIEEAAKKLGIELRGCKLESLGGVREVCRRYKSLDEVRDELKLEKYFFIVDSDANNEDKENDKLFLKKLSFIEDNPITSGGNKSDSSFDNKPGIENLLSKKIIEEAEEYKPEFFDTEERKRGDVVTILKRVREDQKSELCDWICENGEAEDFQCFWQIFEFLGLKK